MSEPVTPFIPPKPEAAAALSGSLEQLGSYLRGLTAGDLSHLNLTVIDRAEGDAPTQLRQAVMEFANRPDVQQRLPFAERVDPSQSFSSYAYDFENRMRSSEAKYADPTKITGVAMLGLALRSMPPAELVDAKIKFSPIIMDSRNCISCGAPKSDLPEISDAGKIAQQLGQINTGFHELGHQIDYDESSALTHAFDAVTHGLHIANYSETKADVFSSLMMLRELGSVGKAYVEVKAASIFGGGDGEHTSTAAAAALDWAKENPDKLANLSVKELFLEAKSLAREAALSWGEVGHVDDYMEKYSLRSARLDRSPEGAARREAAAAERLQALEQYRQEHTDTEGYPKGYNMYEEKLDRLYLEGARNLTKTTAQFITVADQYELQQQINMAQSNGLDGPTSEGAPMFMRPPAPGP